MSWFSIAVHTFVQERRGKVFFNIVIFSIALLISSFLFAKVSVGDKSKVIQDIALGGISILCVFTAILTGNSIISNDIKNRAIYTVMSKPISRWEIILGKSVGLWMLLVVNILIMGLSFYIIATIQGFSPPMILWWALVFIFFEAVIMGELAILFSFISQGYLSMAVVFVIYVIGHTVGDFRLFCKATGSNIIFFISNIIFSVFPNLKAFDIKNQIVHGIGISGRFFATGICYMAVYITFITILTCLCFKGKEV